TVTEGWGNVNGVLTDLANDESSFASRMVRRTLRRRIRDDEVEIGPAGHVRLEGLDDEIIVLASGNLGLVSFAGLEGRATLPEIEQHYPGLVAGIANHPGVGFVMVRPAVGESAIAVGRNGVHHLGSGEVEGVDPLIPFGPNAAIHLLRTDGFANCPDLVVNSFFDPETQQGAAFEELIGFHGGLGGLQTTPFLLAPPVCGVPGLPIVGAERVHELLRSWVAEIRSAVSIESFR
ncbi:MAG: hypothetical protein ACN4IE_13475, partial [Ilumatobacter sp.]